MGCTGSAAKPTEAESKLRGRDRRMSPDTPLLVAKDFLVDTYIQTGAMGKVYKGIRAADNAVVALKFFGYTAKAPDSSEAYEEINLMTALRGVPGMVQLEGVFVDPPKGMLEGKRFAEELPVIVMEYLSGGDLMDRILINKFVSEKQLAAIFRRIIVTLKDCHGRGYIHRDLKLENIIFESNDADALVKLVDFGMMVKLDGNKTVYTTEYLQGTPGYLAPETITDLEYSAKTDFFAAGCCFYAMLSGSMPFDPSDARAPAKVPFAPMVGSAWEGISVEAKSFLAFMLQAEKSSRPDAKQILSHPWLSGEANEQSLDTDYFTRLKSLALRQKVRAFFVDNNIWDNNRKRQRRLNRVVSRHRSLNKSPSPVTKPPSSGIGLETIVEGEELKLEYERKLFKLRAIVIKTFKPEFSFGEAKSFGSDVGGDDQVEVMQATGEHSPVRDRVFSTASMHSSSEEINELSATFRKYVMENGEIPVEGFIQLLHGVGLDEFASEEVFKIFDTEKNGSVDMKDFLLTMIAMKRVEEPLLVPTANSASHGNANTFSVSRRPTETRLADDAKLYFDMFDVKQNGYIDIDELKLVMDFMIPVDDNSAVATRNKHIEDMFLIMDKAENGRVDFEEFKAFYNAVMIASTKNAIQTSLSKAITLAQAKGNSCDELLQENYLASRSLS